MYVEIEKTNQVEEGTSGFLLVLLSALSTSSIAGLIDRHHGKTIVRLLTCSITWNDKGEL